MISVFTFFFSSPRTEKHFPKFSSFLDHFWCISPNLHMKVNFQFMDAATDVKVVLFYFADIIGHLFSNEFQIESLVWGGVGKMIQIGCEDIQGGMFYSLPTLHIIPLENHSCSWWGEASNYLSHFHILHHIKFYLYKSLLILHLSNNVLVMQDL